MKIEVFKNSRPDWDGRYFVRVNVAAPADWFSTGQWASRRFTPEEMQAPGYAFHAWVREVKSAIRRNDKAALADMHSRIFEDALGSLGSAIKAGALKAHRVKP